MHAGISDDFRLGIYIMIPIFEQGQGKGIGHDLDSFIARFDSICKEHIQGKRAKAFAFILYDFVDHDLKQILKDQGVFAKLDRLSGNSLSLFYLHTGTRNAFQIFNTAFLSKLGVEGATTPCVVFFRLKNDKFEDIAVAQLDHADLIHGFNELYGVIEHYIKTDSSRFGEGLRSLKWIKNWGGFIAIEAFRAALKKAFELLF